MKKIIALLLSLALVISGMAVSVFAVNTGVDDGEIDSGEIFKKLNVSFADAKVTEGKTVKVDLILDKNLGFTELTAVFTIDKGLSLTAAEAVEGLTADLKSNTLKLTSVQSYKNNGKIATLTFTADAESAGEKNVAIALSGKNSEEILGTANTAAVITVKKAAVGPAVKGDVNNDGTRNASDLAVLKKAIAGLVSMEDPSVVYPNVDEDAENKVNASDLAILKKLIAGLA